MWVQGSGPAGLELRRTTVMLRWPFSSGLFSPGPLFSSAAISCQGPGRWAQAEGTGWGREEGFAAFPCPVHPCPGVPGVCFLLQTSALGLSRELDLRCQESTDLHAGLRQGGLRREFRVWPGCFQAPSSALGADPTPLAD